MEFRILGPLQVVRQGEPIPLGGAKQRAVLAVFLLRANETVSLDRLIDELWGAQPPAGAVQSVRVRVSRLRKALEDHRGDAPSVLLTSPGGYELRVEQGSLDLDRFERLLADGRRALAGDDPHRAAELLRDALSMWRGPALADLVNEPFAQTEAARLDELRIEAVEERIAADLALGHHAEVVAELDPLVAEHPLRERMRWLQMLALYRCGRQAEALDAYRAARRTLVEEIGTEPGPELRELHEAILRQDPLLAPPAATDKAASPPGPAEPPPGPSEAEPAPASRRPAGRPLRELAAIALAAGIAVLAIFLFTGDDESVAIAENAVGLIDPEDGSVSAQLPVGRGPIAAVADPDSVWIANALDGTVSRIDPETRQVSAFDVGGEPVGLALGAGSLWVANAEDRRVIQVDLETNRALRAIEVGNGPSGVAVAFGSMWAAASVDGMVARFDLSRGRVTQRIPVGANPTAIAAGAGSIWVASEAAGSIARIEPDTGRVLDAINVGNGPGSLAFGGGALWVANRQDGTVSRIDPETEAVTETVRVGTEPGAVAAGEDTVWVANGGDGSVARIDPETAELSETIEVGGSPSALAIADGAIWTTVLASRESHRGGTLRLRWSPPQALTCPCADPIAYDYVEAWELLSLAYDGLIAYRRVGTAAAATLVGNLADEVPEPSPDGKTYVFELRPNIRFSNGDPVRPDDFRSSLERLLGVIEFPPYFDGIRGARDCVTEARSCDLSKGIETDSEAGTITVHLTAPDPEFLHKLTLPIASVVPADSPPRFARRRPLPGTGPYRIASFDPQRGARVVRNPYFEVWSQDARPDGFPDEIVIEFGNDPEAQVAAVERGEADLVTVSGPFGGPLSPARVRELAIRHAGQLHSAPVPETDYMFLNTSLPPFDDARVRRALNYAVDRRYVVGLAGGNQVAQLTCQVVPPGFPGYRPYCPYTLDPSPTGAWAAPDVAKAQRLVEASGTQGTRVEVWAWPEREPIARHFASVLRQLGYRSSLRILPEGPYYEAVLDPSTRAQIGYNGWYADYLAPSNFLQPHYTCPVTTPENLSRFCDREIDAEIGRALAQQGSGSIAANASWESVDRQIADAAPSVALLNRKVAVFVSERVENVQQAPQLGVLLDQVWVR